MRQPVNQHQTTRRLLQVPVASATTSYFTSPSLQRTGSCKLASGTGTGKLYLYRQIPPWRSPAAVLAASADVIARDGVADKLSLRSLVQELGVSHTAPRHHFGDREGLFTALATGYELLADALEDAAADGDFVAVGVGVRIVRGRSPRAFRCHA